MRRFFAILLALATCAFAPTPALVATEAPSHTCCCCDGDGTCGMPNCLPPAAPARPIPASVQVTRIAATETARVVAPARREAKFFAAVAAKPAQPALTRESNVIAPTASAPLFVVHCSFLI